jgi:hypothetical protein
MALTAQQYVERVRNRTHHPADAKIIGELASAKDWVTNRVFKSADGPDQLASWATELTLAATARDYDLGAALSGTLYGVKLLWLKLSQDSVFSPMRPVDTADMRFIFNDLYTASSSIVATGHPVMYDVVNFAKVRFAPPLPSGAVIRVDYWLRPPEIDPTENNVLTYGSDIMEPVQEAIADKATAQIFNIMDDSRDMYWEQQARDKVNDAIHVLHKRAQGPTVTQPFRMRRRRWI